MPERFKVVCIPCKALYKCSALLYFTLLYFLLQSADRSGQSIKLFGSAQVFCSDRPEQFAPCKTFGLFGSHSRTTVLERPPSSSVIVIVSAVRIELLTTRVLSRSSYRILEYSTDIESSSTNYRVVQNRRTPGYLIYIFISPESGS